MLEQIAKYTLYAGVFLIIVGAVLYGAAKLNLPLGRLPGDIRLEGEHGVFYFPLATSLLVSLALTFLLNLFARLFK